MSRRSVRRGLASWAAVATLALLFLPASAMADRHTWGAGGGGGGAGRSDLLAFGVTGEWIPKESWHLGAVNNGRHAGTLSLAGEFGYATGDHEYGGQSGTLSQYVFQVGPRLTWNTPLNYRFQPYLVWLGGFTIEQNFRDKTSLSLAAGFGADIPLFGGQHPWLVLRVQQTWNLIYNDTSDNAYGQWSLALVYRFEKD